MQEENFEKLPKAVFSYGVEEGIFGVKEATSGATGND